MGHRDTESLLRGNFEPLPCSMRERAAHSRIVGAACGWAAVRFQVSVFHNKSARHSREDSMRLSLALIACALVCSAGRGRDRRSGRESPYHRPVFRNDQVMLLSVYLPRERRTDLKCTTRIRSTSSAYWWKRPP
jgi:hypothetical protein